MSSALPRPAGWAPRAGLGTTRRAALVVLVVLGLAAAATAREGRVLPGVLGLVVCWVLAAVALLTRPSPPDRLPETGALQLGGTRVTGLVLLRRRPSRVQAAVVAVLAVAFLAGAGTTWSLLDSVAPEAVFGLVALAVFGVLFAVAAVGMAVASNRVPYLGLTPTHVVIAQTDGSQLELPWSDLVSVDAVVVKLAAGPVPDAVGTWTALRAREGAPGLAGLRLTGPAARVVRQAPGPAGTTTAGLVGDTQWDTDPLLAHRTLEFYRTHPAARRELSGAAAEERVRSRAVLD